MTRLEFLEKARKSHGYKYKYPELLDKITLKDKIVVDLNGVLFTQTVSKHLMGKCPEKASYKKTTSDFISEAKCIWGNKYDYSLVEYDGSLSNVKIILDGFIYEQRASSHLLGVAPEFRKSYDLIQLEKSEYDGKSEIESFLTKYNIGYKRNMRMDGIRFSFYLSDRRTAIEFYGQDSLKQEEVKREDYCEYNYINLIVIRYDQENIIWEILWDNLKSFIK